MSPLYLEFYVFWGLVGVVPLTIVALVFRAVVRALMEGPHARARLAAWGRASGVAVHAAKRVWLPTYPHPLVGGGYSVVFRVKCTDADAVLRDGWAFVPGRESKELVHIRWDASLVLR